MEQRNYLKRRRGPPLWLWLPALAVILVVVMFNVGFVGSGPRTCERCGAVDRGTSVCGIWFEGSHEVSPGQALFERVAGACEEHGWRRSGCWSVGRSMVLYSHEIGNSLYETIAQGGGDAAPAILARYLALPEPRRQELTSLAWREHPLGGWPNEEQEVAGKRAWVRSLLQHAGWSDLD